MYLIVCTRLYEYFVSAGRDEYRGDVIKRAYKFMRTRSLGIYRFVNV